jgi:hypothetical protein
MTWLVADKLSRVRHQYALPSTPNPDLLVDGHNLRISLTAPIVPESSRDDQVEHCQNERRFIESDFVRLELGACGFI